MPAGPPVPAGRRRRRVVMAGLTSLATVAALALAVVLAPGAAADTVQCYHADIAPTPPTGGVVLWSPATADDEPNTLVLPAGYREASPEACAPAGLNPRTIRVAPGAALAISGSGSLSGRDAMVLPWGAGDTTAPDSASLIGQPGSPYFPHEVWTGVSSLQVFAAGPFAARFHTCRYCFLPGASLTIGGLPPGTAFGDHRFFPGDFTGADLAGAALTGTFATFYGLSFDGTDLTGATLTGLLRSATFRGTTLDGATFTKANLGGAAFAGQRFGLAPPRFVNGTTLGSDVEGNCLSVSDGSWLGVSFADATFQAGNGCSNDGFFTNGFTRAAVPLSLWALVVKAGQAKSFTVTDSTIVATAADRATFAGADLRGMRLTGMSVVGLTLDLRGARFDGADLSDARLPGAQLSGASFTNVTAPHLDLQGAALAGQGTMPAATFAGPQTNLQGADFSGADVSGVSFSGSDVSGAAFVGARAVGTDFNGVRAKGTTFADAHLYGDGNAFENATDLSGADFTGAVIAGDSSTSNGFNFTGAAMAGATFDRSVCVACNFAGAHLDHAHVIDAYLPGVNLAGATLTGAELARTWLFCGGLGNPRCPAVPGSTTSWTWPLSLGSGEIYGPVPFAAPPLTPAMLAGVATCPDGSPGDKGCSSLTPNLAVTPWSPPPCSASAHGSCPTPTKTWLPTASAPLAAAPLSIVASAPPTWATPLVPAGFYAGYDDATVRLVGDGTQAVVAGTPGSVCTTSTSPCGDAGPAASAQLGRPAGVAVGLDGTVYIADSALRRVRAVTPAGTITTVAGTGTPCATGSGCGDGGPATGAQLVAANGVAVDPAGNVLVADGAAGLRRVAPGGRITTLAPASAVGTVVAVTVGVDGTLYASTRGPDAVVAVNPASGAVTRLIGTGTSGYNGNRSALGAQPGTATQVNQPTGLAATPDGSLLVADTANNLVRRYNIATGKMAADLAGTGDGHTAPPPGFNGDGRSSDQTQLARPLGVAATVTALAMVADTGNIRVRQVGPPLPSTGVGSGQPPVGGASLVLDCSPGLSWSCRLGPAPADGTVPRTQVNVGVVVLQGGMPVASGPLLLAGGGQHYLVTPTRPLATGSYTLVITAGRASRTVSAVITAAS